jgi:hypothetical protein
VQHKYTSTSDMATNTYISLAVSSYGLACLTSGLCIALDSMLSLHVRMRDGIAELLCPPPPSIHPQVGCGAVQHSPTDSEAVQHRFLVCAVQGLKEPASAAMSGPAVGVA